MSEAAIVQADPPKVDGRRTPGWKGPTPPGRKGGFGRQKGTPNKATAEIKEALDKFLNDEEYQNNLMHRIEGGRADHMELYFWQLRHGRPKVVLEVEQPRSPTRQLAGSLLANLSKAERMQMAELTRKAIAGAPMPEPGVVDAEFKALPAAKKPRGKAKR